MKVTFAPTEKRRPLSYYAATFLVSALLAGGSILSGVSPFCIAFCALFRGGLLYAAFLGGVTGYLLFGTVESQLAYLLGLALCLLFRMLTTPLDTRKNPWLLPVVASAVGVAGGGVLTATLILYLPMMILLYLLQAVLSGGVTYFCAIAKQTLANGITLSQMTLPEQVSVAVALLLILLAVSTVEMTFFLPAAAFWVAFALSLSYQQGVAAGAVSAMAGAALLTLRNGDFALSYAVISACVTFAGLFFSVGRFAGVAAMMLSILAAGAAFEFPSGLLTLSVHALAGGIMFSMVPTEWLTRYFGQPPVKDAAESAGAGYGARLAFAARTLDILRETVHDASVTFGEDVNGQTEVLQTAAHSCGDCKRKQSCWNPKKEDPRNAMTRSLKILLRDGVMEAGTLPEFYKNCSRKEQLANAYTDAYRDYLRRCEESRYREETRRLTATQMSGVADMLRQVGEDMENITAYDAARASAARAIFYQHRVIPEAVNCLIDKSGRVRLEVYLKALPAHLSRLTAELSDSLGCAFDAPQVQTADPLLRLCYFEQARYVVELAKRSVAADGNCCGDATAAFGDPTGKYHLLLADGMGTGVEAAADAKICCRFLSGLIGSGFGYEAARKLLYAALSVSKGGESAVTADAATIDLYTGYTVFHKAGAATSYLCRGSKCYPITTNTLPIGILSDAGYEQKSTTLRAGDLLLICSDGMLSFGDEWLTEELSFLRDKAVGDIADALMESASRRFSGTRPDDRTILLARLTESDS